MVTKAQHVKSAEELRAYLIAQLKDAIIYKMREPERARAVISWIRALDFFDGQELKRWKKQRSMSTKFGKTATHE